ncbi:MAG: ion channel [Reichenbachiella sp.]|uniref:ion channel n=1 Tax=Reichenbachiella sp. TaxID=2184521 RepID=UPI00326549EE
MHSFKKIYPHRFEIFLISQAVILFGSLLVPSTWFEDFMLPILFQINLLAGILLISKKKKLMWFFVVLLALTAVIFGISQKGVDERVFGLSRMVIYFLFYAVVSFEIIKQVWRAKEVSENVILGLISGYVSLGFIGFFICLSIELTHPNSFQGLHLQSADTTILLTDRLIYFSYITMLTIGYGDIIPVTTLAQKATILIGLVGQFYLVILTATIVGKYINQKLQDKTKD